MGVSQTKLFVYASPAEIWLLLTRRERWSDLDLKILIHWLGPPLFLPWCSEATLAIWNERLAKGPYQKNTLPAVRLKPAILRMQIHAFLNYPAPHWFIINKLFQLQKA